MTAQLLEVMVKFEKRYSCKEKRGSRSSDNVGRRSWDERRMSNDNSRRDDRRFNNNDRGYQSGNRGKSENFSREDQRNRGPSENFSRRDRRKGVRLNILKVQDDQVDQSQSTEEIPIRLSAICMSPVELPQKALM
ncbi:hypothetical protein TNCV_4201771 [Trichonephila clavipes]|uniref:Uncharacterized protein n=1 Tax=Trichonephila clavipes TaxID=2585209 RepID=A0A8X6WBQ4_TRICX|nr:hypothetical protein TNCV_4201771 [Trichonephila clavipes]